MTTKNLLMTAPAAGGGASAYMEHVFTSETTTADIKTLAPDTDELGGGWLGDAGFSAQSDGSGVKGPTSALVGVVVQTDGREDVRVAWECIMDQGNLGDKWPGMLVRGTGSSSPSANALKIAGVGTGGVLDLDLTVANTTVVKTWDLSALMSSPPTLDDAIAVVVDCNGNDITLVSVGVNGAAAETLNDTHTLTGSDATTYGAGSGADWYGLTANGLGPIAGLHRFKNIKVEALP